MIDPVQATDILIETIHKDLRHEHYVRVVAHAAQNMRLITGEGLEKDLHHIVSRETDKQFALRKKLFFPLAPAICHRVDVPFSKVHRALGTMESILFKGGKNEKNEKKIAEAMDEFWGDEDMSDYFADRFRELNRQDPNAFVMIEFEPFDPLTEVAKPYPFEVLSHQAINYQKTNNKVDWMIAMLDHKYKDLQGHKHDGHRFLMYFGDVLDFRQTYMREDARDTFDPNSEELQVIKIGNKAYECRILHPYAEDQEKRFQGFQCGHLKDPYTNGDTFISYLQHGYNRMMDTLKSGSEHSLVMALQAHPQIYMYLPPCEGAKEADGSMTACSGGKTLMGKTCTACGGSGKQVPTSVLDVMVFDLPDDFSDRGVADLSKMRHMFSPDVAIITAIREHLRDLEDQTVRDIFTSLQHQRGKVTATATEVNAETEAMNDSLHPYARKVSTARTVAVYALASFVDAEKDLEYTHKFPEDFRLAPLGALLDDLAKATTAGASPIVRELIEDDVVAKKLRDRPAELKMYEVKKKFRPLANVSPQEKAAAMGSGDVAETDKILLLYEGEIYRVLNLVEGFWDKAETAQKELIDKEVQKVLERVRTEKAIAVDFASEMMGSGSGEEEEGQFPKGKDPKAKKTVKPAPFVKA